MVSYRYLGYGTTDSNGIAKLDHDANGNAISHSYTGIGAGKIDIVASLDSTITSNSIVSDVMSFLDAKYICSANNLNVSSNATSTHTDEVYAITLVNPSTYGFVYLSKNTNSSNWIYIERDNVVEFEVLSYTGSNVLRFDGSNSNDAIYTIDRTGKYRIVYNGTSAEVYIDDVFITSVNTSNETKQPRWRVNANSTITLKNILYY